MQPLSKRFGVITGFLLLLILLLVNAIITQRQLDIMVSHQDEVEHTQRVFLAVEHTQALVEYAESGQRGYLYTRDSRYLAPYNQAVAQLGPQLDLLRQMAKGNPTEQAQFAQLRTLIQAKLAELAKTILLYQSGYPETARQVVLSDHGRLLMLQITNISDRIQRQETSLVSARSAAARRSIRRAYLAIDLATLIAILGLFLVAFYIFNTVALRDAYARQIAEREAWFRSTLTSLGDAVIATDAKGSVTFLNPMAESLMGTSLLLTRGKPIADVFPIFNETTGKPVENPIGKVLEHGFIIGLANHTVLQRTDGVLIPIEDSAAPIHDANNKLIGVVMVFRDATLERKSQEVLRKTEKLAAAARLAATVAHEINNPLEAIGNLIYIVKTTDGVPAPALGHLSLAEQELTRVSHITRQTLGFYRESKLPGPVDLPSLVESVLNIYSNKFRTKDITVEREFQDCPPIHALAGELNQAIANLVSNAADAVSQNGLIHVRITCEDAADSQIVSIVIEDNGPGIAPEYRDRIFEPFFTTKKDVGTGLGLWVTKEIIERHNGTLVVHCVTAAEAAKSNSATGTTFTITLPVRPEPENPAATPQADV